MYHLSKIYLIFFHLFLVQFVVGQTQAELDALKNLPQDAYWIVGKYRNTKTYKQEKPIWRYNLSDPLTAIQIGVGTDPILSPDGQTVAYTLTPNEPDDDISEFWLMDADGENQRKLAGNIPFIRRPKWGSESKFIYYTSHPAPTTSWGASGDLWQIEVATAVTKLLYSSPSEFFYNFDVHENEAAVVWGSDTLEAFAWSRVVKMDPSDPIKTETLLDIVGSDWMDYSPGGNQITFASSGGINIWQRHGQGWIKNSPFDFTALTGFELRWNSWTNHPDYIVVQDKRPGFKVSPWLYSISDSTITRLNWELFENVRTSLYIPNAPPETYTPIIPEPAPPAGMGITYVPSINAGEAGIIYRNDFSNGFQPQQLAVGDSPILDPDGIWLAYTVPQGLLSEIWIIQTDGNEKRKVWDALPNLRHLQWNENGEYLVFTWNTTADPSGNTGFVWRIHVINGTAELIYENSQDVFTSLDIYGDKLLVVLNTVGGLVWQVTYDNLNPIQPVRVDTLMWKRMPNNPFPKIFPSYSADGEHVATLSDDGTALHIWQPAQSGDSLFWWEKIQVIDVVAATGGPAKSFTWTNDKDLIQFLPVSDTASAWLLHVPTSGFNALQGISSTTGASTFIGDPPFAGVTGKKRFSYKPKQPAVSLNNRFLVFTGPGTHSFELSNIRGSVVWRNTQIGPGQVSLPEFLATGHYIVNLTGTTR